MHKRPERTAGTKLAATLALMLAVTCAHSATGWDDPKFLQEKAELLMARATGAQAQQTAVAARDTKALSSAECTALEVSAKQAATQYVERGVVVSPGSVIQNSTCFLDIAQIKIPVSLTGIGFLDGLINRFMTNLMSSACAKGMSFLNDLKSSAINQITSGVNGALNINQLNVAGVNVGGAIGSTVSQATNGAVNAATTDLIRNATNSASSNSSSSGLFGGGDASGGLFGGASTPASAGF
ncbi:hypothetical protein ACSFA0_23725 [Variovorax sp. LT1P1]|uniref:hypothetical protein n=1 Tax=Variovorax sp. LT1P1 TaxID=3443730 RepID=UPI003F4562C6